MDSPSESLSGESERTRAGGGGGAGKAFALPLLGRAGIKYILAKAYFSIVSYVYS